MNKGILKNILKGVLVFILVIIAFISLLYLTSLIPTKYLEKNVKESANILLNESNRKKVYIPYKNITMQFDNYTDALMINTAYSIDTSTPLYSVFTAKKNYIPNITKTIQQDSVSELKSASKYKYHNEVGELYDTANNNIEESFEYARYWHGYLIFLRPMLAIFNINVIRIIAITIFAILGMILFALLLKKFSIYTAIFFIIGLIGVEYFYIGISLQGMFVFFISLITSIYILIREDKIKSICMCFFMVGMFTNFLDFLTVPIVTYGIPLTIYFLIQQKERNLTYKEIIIIFMKTGITWFLGYSITWVTKWALMDIMYERNLIEVSLGQVMYRSTGNGANYSYLKVLFNNLYYVIVPLFINTFIAFFIEIFNKKSKINNPINQKIPYIIISIIPFVWYSILKNHSLNHAFFTYRNLVLTIITIPIAMIDFRFLYHNCRDNIK
ncbi:MAG: hypothetical protein Q4G05_05075 [Clostridia bacterium]|nr:hypothetical protein [Clostridia bacterium]